jgi:hypothetical protein
MEETMASKKYPTDVLVQASAILAACKQINPDMKTGMITQATFAEELTHTHTIQAQLHVLEMQMIDLRNKRDQQLTRMWDVIKRTRATVKGTYGDDSTEYELVGGTRASERKRSTRRQGT